MAIYADAARFVNLVARQADARLYPETLNPKVLDVLNSAEYAETSYLDVLPKDIQQKVFIDFFCSNSGVTISNWLACTRILEPPLADAGGESVRRAPIETSARQRLEELKQVVDPSKPAVDQLLSFIFQQAFTRAPEDKRQDERELMIDQAKKLTPKLSTTLPFEFWRLRYRVESLASAVLDNFFVKIGLIYLTYRMGRWAQPRIAFHLSQTVIPHGMKLLINHAPLPAIRIISKGVQFVQWTTQNYWKASIGFMVTTSISARYFPAWAHRAVVVVERIAFLPTKVAGYLFMGPLWMFWYAWSAQTGLTKNVRSINDGSKARYFETGGIQAYRVWIDIMKNGARAGFFPSQPVKKPAAQS